MKNYGTDGEVNKRLNDIETELPEKVSKTDTDVSSNGWVLDEDTLSSDDNTKVPTQQSVKAYVDTAAIGLYDHKGAYDASANSPDLDYSDSASASGIKKADAYTVSVAGTFFTEALEAGDVIIADQDDPTLLTHWTRVSKNYSFGTTVGTICEGNDSRLSNDRDPNAHASEHTDGTDDIQDATASVKGLATATQITKLDALSTTKITNGDTTPAEDETYVDTESNFVDIKAGLQSGEAAATAISLSVATNTNPGTGGAISIVAGHGGESTGGGVTIASGGGDGGGGNVSMQVGTGSSSYGNIVIGNNNVDNLSLKGNIIDLTSSLSIDGAPAATAINLGVTQGTDGDVGGAINIKAGKGDGNNSGGALNLTAGDGHGTAIGGNVNIAGGNNSSNNGGDVVIAGGSGLNDDGSIRIGLSNTKAINIGQSGAVTTLQGAAREARLQTQPASNATPLAIATTQYVTDSVSGVSTTKITNGDTSPAVDETYVDTGSNFVDIKAGLQSGVAAATAISLSVDDNTATGVGGAISIIAGKSSGDEKGGAIDIIGGLSPLDSSGGTVTVKGGDGEISYPQSVAGHLHLYGGNAAAQDGDGGDVVIDGGTGARTGNIDIGITNAGTIVIGNSVRDTRLGAQPADNSVPLAIATTQFVIDNAGGGHTIEDEGTPLTARDTIDFVGAGVTVTDDAVSGQTVVTIPGGGTTSDPIAYTATGTDQNLNSPTITTTQSSFIPALGQGPPYVSLYVGSIRYYQEGTVVGVSDTWPSDGSLTYGTIKFDVATVYTTTWNEFASSSNNGIQTFTFSGGEGYFEYMYDRDAWYYAFNGNDADIVVAQNGDVFKTSIAPENLVVDHNGKWGPISLAGKADKSNVLELDNTSAFTPDADYEPATKKYVDDNARHTIEDEGTPLTARGTLDFQGAGVTVTDDAVSGQTIVTISGGGHTIEDEGTPLTDRDILDFVGAGVTVTDDAVSGQTIVTIPGGGGVSTFTRHIATSGGDQVWTESGPYISTITAATHGIGQSPAFAIKVACYTVSGTDHIEVIPTEIKIASNNDITITMPGNADLKVFIIG